MSVESIILIAWFSIGCKLCWKDNYEYIHTNYRMSEQERWDRMMRRLPFLPSAIAVMVVKDIIKHPTRAQTNLTEEQKSELYRQYLNEKFKV